ncbi:MAG: hypothetical protein PHZ11_05560 [Desulfitobacteriaceae bacterium]|nr:hypothetical protein [Desulfitobacteriaceae bacterium]
MPTINRIRILNFSYNNNTRHILDESFNFHGGENVLLNLANGGGKSVLVQLFLQPVVPGIKIQGRRISGFFHRQKQPTFILLEWKLDEGGGYLLTGMALIPAEAAGGEEGKGKIRYFTFTCKYNGSNAFDIKHIPLAEKQGNLLHLLSFQEARDLMREKQQKDPYLFAYFPEEDGADYGRHLAQYGIVQGEWRNVIAKINDNEGGIEEIFQKYKTSSQLLDEWIIKNIEKSMYKEKAELHRLEEMLEKLVQEVTENESYILEKALFSEFLAVYGQQSEELAVFLQNLEEQKDQAEKLAALSAYLTAQLETLEDKKAENELAKDKARREEQRIELEDRSHSYLQKKAKYAAALELLSTVENQLKDTEGSLEQAQMAEKIQQAARLVGEIRHKEAKLSGIEESLAAEKASYDKDRRIGELEYSLKNLLEKELTLLREKELSWQAEKQAGELNLQQVEDDLLANTQKKSAVDSQKGQLTERKSHMEKEAANTLQKLGLSLRRNLLGELNSAEVEQAKSNLAKVLAALEQEESRLAVEQTANAQEQQELETDIQHCQARQAEEKMRLQNIKRDILEYEQQEAETKEILTRYDLEPALLFQPPRLAAAFKQRIQALAGSVEQVGLRWHDAQENLLSLKNGRLHVPAELVMLFSELDISYDTGETYLRGLPADLCQKMLQNNPLLPYAFILTRSEIARVAEAMEKLTHQESLTQQENLTLKRVIPFISYEDLNVEMESSGRMVQTNQGITLACFYEGRIFAPDSLEQLIAELEQKSSQALEQREHYSEEHRRTVADQATCARFAYDADYRYNLGFKENAAEEKLAELDQQIMEAEIKRSTLLIRQEEISDLLKENLSKQLPAQNRIESFQEFLAKEPAYQLCCRELSGVLDESKALEIRKTKLEAQRNTLQKELSTVRNALRDNERQLIDVQQQYELYQQAPQTRLVEGTIEELTERLRVVRDTYTAGIKHLETQKQDLQADIGQKRTELSNLHLQEEAYATVRYEAEKAGRLREEISGLEKSVKELQGELRTAIAKEASTKEALSSALDEVKRLGYDHPLPPEEISGDFSGRRKQVRIQLKELDRESLALQTQSTLYERLKSQIAQTMDFQGIKAAKDFVPEQDIEAQTKMLQQQYREKDKQNRRDIGQIRNDYARLKETYREKNSNIDNIFRGLDKLWEDALLQDDSIMSSILSYDRFYYLYECMSIHQEKLSDLLKIYELQLANLEQNKNNMVEQSFLHGMRIFDEIQWISDNSKVRLQGRSRPVQMLKIDLVLDSLENAKDRMKNYIETAIEKVRQESRLNKKPEEIRRSVMKLMSSRELLNVYLDNSNIPVKVYKIDYTMQNSRLKLWEDAAHENSGGEKFVVFFSVLSALMSYARTRAREGLGGMSEKETSVLIMDNPFGPISSEHLLNPLFEIAKQHRTQLICLSDLKQNSIMNCFNLIYMLKIRTTAIGKNEYLKFEEIIRDPGTLQEDERLEKAVFRSTEARQIAMFGEE